MSVRTITLVAVSMTLAISGLHAQDCPEFAGNFPSGNANAVIADGDLAYVGIHDGVLVIDLEDPLYPKVIGRLALPDRAEGVALGEEYLYVADYHEGLRIIDVSDPIRPFEVGSADTDAARGIAVDDGHAFVADGGSGLRVFDVSDPTNPVEIGSSAVDDYARDVAVAGGYAFVTDNYSGLRIIDVSAPSRPTEVAVFPTTNFAMSVEVLGGYAYLVDLYDGLIVIDVLDPSNPVQVGSIDTGAYSDVAVEGRYAYVASRNSGLRVIDISDPTSPTEIGVSSSGGNVVSVTGDHAVTIGSSSLVMIRISEPTAPAKVGRLGMSSVFEDVVVKGSLAYITDRGGRPDRGLRIVDISIPDRPYELGSLFTLTQVLGLTVEGSHAFVANAQYGLHIIDVSDPSVPVEVGWVDAVIARAVAYADGHAYVADGSGGLRVVDVANPSAPFTVGVLDTPGNARGIAVAEEYAYLADYTSMRVIDISDPTNPTEEGFIDLFRAYDVAVRGDFAYVVSLSGPGLTVIDISTPGDPIEVGATTSSPFGGRSVELDGGYAFVAGATGLHVVDISSPASPVEVAEVGPSMRGVAVQGGYAYAGSASRGLFIWETSCLSDPSQELCFDGIDNNGDGIVDCADPQCDLATGGLCDTGQPGACAIGTESCSESAWICLPEPDCETAEDLPPSVTAFPHECGDSVEVPWGRLVTIEVVASDPEGLEPVDLGILDPPVSSQTDPELPVEAEIGDSVSTVFSWRPDCGESAQLQFIAGEPDAQWAECVIEIVTAQDSDCDCLTDDEELSSGTNPDDWDTDGDALADGWEVNPSRDLDNNCEPLPITLDGADPLRKDIYLEVDWLELSGDHSHRPTDMAVEYVESAFSDSPVYVCDTGDRSNWPCSSDDECPGAEPGRACSRRSGILLHIDRNGMIPEEGRERINMTWDGDPCSGEGTDFDTLKNQYFDDSTRERFFHYAIFGHLITPTERNEEGTCDSRGTLGLAEIWGNDLIVGLGSFTSRCWGGVNDGYLCEPFEQQCPGGLCLRIVGDKDEDGTSDYGVGTTWMQASGLMHELGHNLNLAHGGVDKVNNKPNYVSVMNYTYAFRGIGFPDLEESRLDYSADALPNNVDCSPLQTCARYLDEAELDEQLPIAIESLQIIYYCDDCDDWQCARGARGSGAAIDWDCDGRTDLVPVSANINGSEEFPEVLWGYNDWANLRFDFQDSGNFADLSRDEITTEEIDVETFNRMALDYFPLEVDIDIKPGSYPNPINLKSKGVVPVAILSSPEFDATTVVLEATFFAGSNDIKHRGHIEDVNGDGYLDLLLHFKTRSLVDLSLDSESASLIAKTEDQHIVSGEDDVLVVPE